MSKASNAESVADSSHDGDRPSPHSAFPGSMVAKVSLAIGGSLWVIAVLSWLVFDKPFAAASHRQPVAVPSPAYSPRLSPKKVPPLPQIVRLQINGKTPQLRYLIPLTKQRPTKTLTLSWEVQGGQDMQVEVLPAPGKVAAKGSLIYRIAQRPATETLILKATNSAGQTVSQSVTVEVFNPVAKAAPTTQPDRPAVTAPRSP